MKTDFVQPKFTGARFDEHTLPVDVARDLAAYEALIVELAKHLYLQDHPERQRVPKGFAGNFRLDIERIDEGSTKPLLALVLAGVLALQGGDRDYFENARDLIAECIASPIDALPIAFPKELLAHFNQIGRSLREDEALELPVRNANNLPARLTQEKRRQLVLATEQEYEKDVDLFGTIAELDWEKSTFRMRLNDGGQVSIQIPDSFVGKAREFGGRPRHQVNVKGVASYDSYERLQKIKSIDSLEIVRNYELAGKFDELAQLNDGWFEGNGFAPDANALALVSEKMIANYPDKLPLPQVVPKQDGNLLLEWMADGDPSLDIDLVASQASFHAFDINNDDIERDFALNAAGWEMLFAFLGDNIKARNA